MEILIVLIVLAALVLMVHAWRASLIVLALLLGVVAWGSSLPPAASPVVSSSVKDTFCGMPYESRRTSYLVVMGDAKRQEYARMSPRERSSMWTTIGARVGCAF